MKEEQVPWLLYSFHWVLSDESHDVCDVMRHGLAKPTSVHPHCWLLSQLQFGSSLWGREEVIMNGLVRSGKSHIIKALITKNKLGGLYPENPEFLCPETLHSEDEDDFLIEVMVTVTAGSQCASPELPKVW